MGEIILLLPSCYNEMNFTKIIDVKHAQELKQDSAHSGTKEKPCKKEYNILLRQEKETLDKRNKLIKELKVSFKGCRNDVLRGKTSNVGKREKNIKILREMKFANLQASDIRIDLSLELFNKFFASQELDVAETIILFIYGIYRSRNGLDVGAAVAHLIKHLFKQNATAMLAKAIDYSYEHLLSFVESVQADDVDMSPGEESVNSFYKMFQYMDKIRKTKVYVALVRFVSYIWSFFIGLLSTDDPDSKERFDTITKKLNLEQLDFSPCALIDMLEKLSFLAKQGFQSVRTGNIMDFWHSSGEYVIWFKKIQELNIRKLFVNSVDETKRITLAQIITEYDRLIAQGDEILPLCESFEKKLIGNEVAKLKTDRFAFNTSMAAMKTRKAPFSMLIFGGPNVGKTAFCDTVFSFVADVKNLVKTSDAKYVRNFADEYWSNFKTSCWYVLFDDIAFECANVIKSFRDASQREIIQVNNNTTMIVNMAKLEEKGNILCAPELVLATTNTKGLNAHSLFAEPYAARRRFPYTITLTVKKEYTSKDDFGLDSKLVPETEGALDVWDILVERPIKHVDDPAKYEKLHSFTKMSDFLMWLKVALHAHDEIQEMILKKVDKLTTKKFCLTCCKVEGTCDCAPVQAMSDLTFPELWEYAKGAPDSPPQCPKFAPDFYISEWMTDLYFRVYAMFTFLGWIDWGLFFTYITRCLYWNFMPTYCLTFLSTFVFYFYWAFIWKCTSQIFFYVGVNYIIFPVYNILPGSVRQFMVEWVANRIVNRMYGKRAKEIAFLVAGLSGAVATLGIFYYTRPASRKIVADSTIVHEPEPDPPAVVQGSVVTLPVDVKEKFTDSSSDINHYWNDISVSSSSSFGEHVHSWKNLTDSEIDSKLAENLVFIKCFEPHRRRKGRGVIIGGNVILTNRHLFIGAPHYEFIYKSGGITRNMINYTPSVSDIVDIPERDLRFIRVRKLPNHKSIVGLIPRMFLMDLRCPGYTLMRDIEGEVKKSPTGMIEYSGVISMNDPGNNCMITNDCYELSNQDNVDGDCGAMYIARCNQGPVFTGIHQSCHGGLGRCAVLTQDMVQLAVDRLGPLIEGGDLIRENLTYTVHPLSEKSTLRKIPELQCEVFGSTGSRFPSKSKVVRTMLYHEMSSLGIKDDFGAPVMNKREVWEQQITPIVNKAETLDMDLMDFAKEMYIEEVIETLPSKLTITPLSDFESLNGVIGNKNINSIVKNTSAGFPLCKPKTDFMNVLDDNTMIIDDKIVKDVADMEAKYRSGCRCMPAFMGSLKDEVVTKKKIETNKTRMFTGSAFSFSLVFRKYFLPLVAKIQENCQLFESYPGTNATGPDWEVLEKHLCQFGRDRICAGDYQAFDKNMGPAVIDAAFDILITLARRCDYSKTDLLAMKAMACDVTYPIIVADGDIFMAHGCNPSGHPLTVVINCLVNCIYLRMAFINYNPEKKFKQHVALATYGDDNIFGVSKDCKFDHTLLSDFLASQGIVYTMADKTAKSIPFIHISKASFLKRNFHFSVELNHTIGQLEWKSIERGLLYVIPSRALCPEAQMADKMKAALMEIFFYGKEMYNIFLHRFTIMSLEADIEEYCKHSLFEYDVLFAAFTAVFEGKVQGSCESLTLETCDYCGREDCIMHTSNSIVCPRCKRCRSLVVLEDDEWFFGCLYCESEHPLKCDMCNVHTVDYRERISPIHNAFFCSECFEDIDARSGYIVLARSNAHVYCDPAGGSMTPARLLGVRDSDFSAGLEVWNDYFDGWDPGERL
jgi:hypothetical protein